MRRGELGRVSSGLHFCDQRSLSFRQIAKACVEKSHMAGAERIGERIAGIVRPFSTRYCRTHQCKNPRQFTIFRDQMWASQF